MTGYRIYPLDVFNRVISRFDADCASDEAAFITAEATLRAGTNAEVWQGTRCLGQVSAVSVQRQHSTDDTAKPAIEAARGRFGEDEWLDLSPTRKVTVIYEEMRRLALS